MIRKIWLYRAIMGIVAAYVVVALGSWVWSAAMPSSSIRPLLSDSGIRWFFGTFTNNLAQPVLVWVILLGIALGTSRECGLWKVIGKLATSCHAISILERRGLWAALELIAVEAAVMALLIFPRHAILLSVMGDIFPSSFSESLVAVISFMILTASITFGLFSGNIHNYRGAVASALKGGSVLKIVLCLYVLIAELIAIIGYIF